MARIPEFSRGFVESGAANEGFDAGGALAKAANVLGEIGRRQREAADTTFVNEQVVEQKVRISEQLEEFRKNKQNTPTGSAREFDEILKTTADDLVKNAPDHISGRAKRALKSEINNLRVGVFQNNQTWENNQRLFNFSESVSNSAKSLNLLAFRARDERQLDQLLNDADATVVAGSTLGMTETELAEMRGKVRTGVAENFIIGMTETDPEESIRLIDSKRFDGQITRPG